MFVRNSNFCGKIINNFEEKSDFNNVIVILRDMSGSMTDDMTEVLETIETIKKW